MDENRYVAVSLLDRSKACDSISHEHYQSKLKDLGFSESANDVIHDFIRNRQQKTIVKYNESQKISLHQSISQGTIMVPLNFHLYMNDLNKI